MCSISVRKPERKRQIGSFRHRWEYYIKMDLNEILCEDVDWIDLVEDRKFYD
jgi:hypothetical protein